MGLYDILPTKARQALYAVYAFIGLGLGATQVAYSAAEAGQPMWLTVALAVFAFLGTAFGFTAAANAQPPAELDTEYLPSEVHTYYGHRPTGLTDPSINTGGASPRAPDVDYT